MGNTYSSLHYHLVFSAKNRERWITPAVEGRVWSYMAGIAAENGMKAICIGGVEDHVHLLLGIPPSLEVSKACQFIKGGSSKWIHETFPDMRCFAWQDGYGAFTLGKSQLRDTIAYIQNQRTHHETKTFQEEYISFLRKHDIEFAEKYVFG